MGHIRYEVDDGVATITIDRPEKRNAMTYSVLRDFTQAIWRAGDDADARVVIVTGAGGAFCAGTDLAELDETPEGERGSAARIDDPRAAEVWPLAACPKPVIAAVDGAAVGMGAEFATQCDVRIASDRARFGWVFVQRGLVPDTGAGSFLLPRLVGPTAALRLLLSGELIDAAEAQRIGFVSQVVGADDLADAARAEAERYLRPRRSPSPAPSGSSTRRWRASGRHTSSHPVCPRGVLRLRGPRRGRAGVPRAATGRASPGGSSRAACHAGCLDRAMTVAPMEARWRSSGWWPRRRASTRTCSQSLGSRQRTLSEPPAPGAVDLPAERALVPGVFDERLGVVGHESRVERRPGPPSRP